MAIDCFGRWWLVRMTAAVTGDADGLLVFSGKGGGQPRRWWEVAQLFVACDICDIAFVACDISFVSNPEKVRLSECLKTVWNFPGGTENKSDVFLHDIRKRIFFSTVFLFSNRKEMRMGAELQHSDVFLPGIFFWYIPMHP